MAIWEKTKESNAQDKDWQQFIEGLDHHFIANEITDKENQPVCVRQ